MANQFLIKNRMQDMKALNPTEIAALESGSYAGVQLLGYHEKGDTPGSIIYYYVNPLTEPDPGPEDGGSVITLNGGGKLIHKFGYNVYVAYFGVKGDGVTDDTNALKNALSFIESRAGKNTDLVKVKGGKLISHSSKGVLISDTLETNKLLDIDFDLLVYKGPRNRTAILLNGLYNCSIRISVLAELPADNFKGVVVKNGLRNNIVLDKISGFTTNFELLAHDYGCAWNDIYMKENQVSLNHISLRNLGASGWINANSFHNAECSNGNSGDIIQQSVLKERCYVNIEGDGLYKPNTLNFFNCRFEGGSNTNQWNGHNSYVIVANIPFHNITFKDARVENVNNTVFGKLHFDCTNFKFKASTIGLDQDFWNQDNQVFPLREPRKFRHFYTSPDFKTHTKFISSNGTNRLRCSYFDGFYFGNGLNAHHSGEGVFGITLKVSNSPVLRVKALQRVSFVLLDSAKNIISDELLLEKQNLWIKNSIDQGASYTNIATAGNNKFITTPNDKAWDLQIKIIPEAAFIMFCTKSLEGNMIVDVFDKDWNQVELSYIKEGGRINFDAIQIAEAVDNPNILNTDYKIGEKYYNVNSGILYTIIGLAPLKYSTNNILPSATTTVKGLVNQSLSSADSGVPPSTVYNQSEVSSILVELRDLKSKLRAAGILAT